VKKLLALSIAIAFAAGTAGFTYAQTSTTPPAAEKKADEKMEKPKKMPSRSASGTVKSAAADSIVVAGKEKGKEAEWTFALDPKTTIKKGGKAITAADLKAGDNVSVRYHEMDGKTVAQTVTVRGGGMAKAKKEEAKPAEKSK
jgi:lipopolysaccharide export LptBFGC system permease protein LptF